MGFFSALMPREPRFFALFDRHAHFVVECGRGCRNCSGLPREPRRAALIQRIGEIERFRRLQLVSSALYSIGHGSNDAQKTMGIIWLLLISAGVASKEHLPAWVIVSCFVAIALGTMFGGWRIVKTMGQKITKLRPVGGFAAETAGAFT